MGFKHYIKNLRRRLVWATGLPQECTQIAHAVEQTLLRTTQTLQVHLPSYIDRGTQLLLAMKYRENFAQSRELLRFDDIEFRNHSQNGEDGILWYVFALLGTVNKTCVEICAGNGTECNCANLIINHGWTGLLFDGNEQSVKDGQAFYRKHPDTFVYPPSFVHVWITAENVDHLITSHGIHGEIDLLSLDIDGVDYWIWKAIEAIRPRVVMAEIQAIWGSEASVTVPYDSEFKAQYVDGFGVYSGASLPAFVKVARQKGYRLIGGQRYGFNAVFVRNDVGQDIFPEVTAASCLAHPFVTWAHDTLLPKVRARDWQEV